MGRSLVIVLHTLLAASGVVQSSSPVDLSTLPQQLQKTSASVFPALQEIAVNVFNHPELSGSETFAHDQVVNHFSALKGQWSVTPHAFGQKTAWSLVFENKPSSWKGTTLPTIGFMAEMDALPAIGHACGHNLILLNGIAAATLTRQALIDFKIPARILVVGTPDEEQTAGKQRLLNAGAFNGGDVWMMAHPTIFNGITPMQARRNALLRMTGSTHQEAVHKAFDQLAIVVDLNANLTALGVGTASSLTPVEDVGMFSSNVVQTQLQLGIVGSTGVVEQTVAAVKALPAFTAINFTLTQDKDGNVLTTDGPGGHASEGTKGVLDFVVETFRRLRDTSATPAFAFYLPGNTTAKELDVTVSARTRYTIDLPALEKTLEAQASKIPKSLAWDLEYKALELGPYFGDRLTALWKQPEYNESWITEDVAPAATDAGWVQNAVIDPTTHKLIGETFPVFHPNYGICPDPSGAGCPFNHVAAFKELAGTDLAYSQTEKMARSLAHIAVELAADPALMAQARILVK